LGLLNKQMAEGRDFEVFLKECVARDVCIPAMGVSNIDQKKAKQLGYVFTECSNMIGSLVYRVTEMTAEDKELQQWLKYIAKHDIVIKEGPWYRENRPNILDFGFSESRTLDSQWVSIKLQRTK